MTHIETRRIAATACMLEMMQILGWDWKQYCYFKYECGLEYLNILTNNDAFVIGLLESSVIFWNWWKIHWTLREETFLLEYDSANRMYHIETSRAMYEALHNPNELVNGVGHYRFDMENGYAKIIKTIQHEDR
jgi:hypothetical protein